MMQRFFLWAALLTATACGSKQHQEQEQPGSSGADVTEVTLTEAQLQQAKIDTGRLMHRTMTSRLQVNGLVDVPPQSMISVSFPLGGYLKSTRLLPGLRIRKGEVLAVLEDPQYIQLQQDYLSARARLRFAEADYRRQQELGTTQASSEKMVQQAQAEFERLQVEVKGLGTKLQLININPATLTVESISRSVQVYSPINGFVSKVNVNIGKYVSPTEVLFELVDPSDIHLNLTVFEKDAALLRIGQRVVAYSNHKPDEKHLADIFLISHNINEDRAVQVHCHFDDYDPLLLPGMYMNAVVEVEQTKAPVLPAEAVVRWQNKHYVFIVKEKNLFELLEVTPGVTDGGYTIIQPVTDRKLETLTFVTRNAYTLLMKMKNNTGDE
ncbi:MAG TPA: efflux RND transporter periplasmic adaptor subunit [Lacibacter sp.]|nr:efflux RND transporter periplasmic adaptor subunit [Lacibacter sp.]HMO88693.1 efflux RND transporter periplasmic adaptor subunit [Lacibacter sp.]HMP87866.1 efflux RND transporter periplasmic adaptor subunit [Lacibacter sp.]